MVKQFLTYYFPYVYFYRKNAGKTNKAEHAYYTELYRDAFPNLF